ncbi:L-lactate dehydrogenase B chain-like [Microcaecilia unicolor]|uniref:L-lactate dehydrogenase B chain-like n=1 Tax=Microcaecilia unicolor TaxID=1415580 RepID=A0A6P7XIK8_9AMPH|nr:L-lactate dehydrogenase B chain-like [Microcaecilia unicolor]
MAVFRESLMLDLNPEEVTATRARSKVTLVGIGQVGVACTVSILQANVADEIALVDIREEKLHREAAHLQHGGLFLNAPKILVDKDYSVTANSRLCAVAVGVHLREGESKHTLLERNVEAFKYIIPNLAKYSPDAVLLIVSNPVDILTYVAWKLSGFPKHRVIGTGTSPNSASFRSLLSEKLQINPSNIQGYIIGELGESSVAVWSGTNVAGVSLQDVDPSWDGDQELTRQIQRNIADSAKEAGSLRGETSWALGLSVANLVQAILKNLRTIHCVSTLATGLHGIEDEIFLSLPCILGSCGVCGILKQPLKETETRQLRSSAERLGAINKELRL